MGEGGYRQINKTLNVCAFEDYLITQQSQLPELEDVAQISPRVIRILGQNAGKFTLQGTNTYLVGTGRERLLIDTGQGYREWANLVDSQLRLRSAKLSHVLLTHWHGDHTGGVRDLIDMYPEVEGSVYKNAPERGQQSIEAGQIFRVEGATIRAVHAPGHSHDHMCFVLVEENAMFTGDNVLGHGTSAVEQLGQYMKTLSMLRAQGCTIGYPAHGAVISDLPGKITSELMQKTRREKQCLDALGCAAVRPGMTVRELIVVMHGADLDEEVRELAIEPFVDEVLRKLAEDGKVAFRVQQGERRWFALPSVRPNKTSGLSRA